MKFLFPVIIIAIFAGSLFASEVELQTEKFIGAEQVYNFISVPHDEFWNKHCLSFQLRRDDNNDFRFAVGYRINEVEKTLIFDPTQPRRQKHFYRIKYFYVNSDNQPVETVTFKCLLPKQDDIP